MDHCLKPMLGKQRLHGRAIGKIGVHEAETLICSQNFQPGPLQYRIIIVVETVQADNVSALGQEPTSRMKADESRRAGDQYCVIRHLAPREARSWIGPARACL